jgi:hypothetical protein
MRSIPALKGNSTILVKILESPWINFDMQLSISSSPFSFLIILLLFIELVVEPKYTWSFSVSGIEQYTPSITREAGIRNIGRNGAQNDVFSPFEPAFAAFGTFRY